MYSSTHLCALQMLLNKCVCFPASGAVHMGEMGSAFVQIVPSKFNYIKYHNQTLFQVTSFILRDMFAFLREKSFRDATDTGGILKATKLWLQEQHVSGIDESFGRVLDIAEYVLHGSHFAYVLPLCYRHVRECLHLQKHNVSPQFLRTVLQCMPASFPDLQNPSMLDWYFDHQGDTCSLRVLMTIVDETELNSRLTAGSPPPLAAAAARGPKPGRHNTACHHGFYRTFVSCLQRFFSMVQSLKLQKRNAGLATSHLVFFCRDPSFSICSTTSDAQGPLVWLGLGEEKVIIETGQKFCKPVAIKSHQNVDPEMFSRMMGRMKTGSFIASTQELNLHVHGLNGQVTAPSPRSGPAVSSNSGKYWVSEAGICSLYELFEHGVLEEERSTQTHRRLVKEVRFVAWSA